MRPPGITGELLDRVKLRRSPRRALQPLALAAIVCLAPAVPRAAAAAETQWWITDSVADHAKSESRGVLVGPNGVLGLGPRATVTLADSLTTIWAVAVLKDGSVALAGEHGRIDRWTEARGIRPWVRLSVGQVLSLAPDGDGLVAGTGPDGRLYRVGARGDTTLIVSTGERYVWALVSAGSNAWYAATGTHGKLLRIEGRRSRVVLDSDESNLVSLIPDGKGGVYTGGDSKGRVVHVGADGRARTVFDAPESEVRALALGGDGALYAAALSGTAVSTDEGGEGEATPTKAPVSGAKAVVYRIVPDSVSSTYWVSPQPLVYALARTSTGILAATGSRAGLFLLGQPNSAVQWLAAPQGQITALAVESGGRVLAATSNPGALWSVGPARSERGELLSQGFDAKRIARFGRIRWRGDLAGGRIELHTRSGNTDAPDTTWSEWEGGVAGADGIKISSPPAQYLQWRITLAGGNPRIESVETAWREQNLPPRVEEVVVAPQGQGFREGDLLPRSEPITQNLPGGQKVEYSINPGPTPRMLRELPMWARGLRTVQWKGSDTNGDPLIYRVDVRSEAGGPWIKVAEDLDQTSFTWDTNALSDGRYRLRVIASDRSGNAVGEERTAEALSEPFTLDNTPPAIPSLEARGEPARIDVQGRAEDGQSPLSRIEVSVDDNDWRTITPDGGLADDRELSFHARLEPSTAGDHTVSVRAVDLAGNSTIRAARVTVPRAR